MNSATTVQKLARFGATLALAFAIGVVAAPTSTFATDEEYVEGEESAYVEEGAHDDNDNHHGVAPFVLETVNGGVQQAAAGTGFGLGVGEAASGEPGLGIGAAGTGVGAAAADLGLGIPSGVLGQP